MPGLVRWSVDDVMALRSRFPTKKISDVDVRRRTSTYVHVRPRTSTYVERTSTYVDVRRLTWTYHVDVRPRTSTYVHVRPEGVEVNFVRGGKEAFEAGLARSEDPAGLLAHIFTCRTEGLQGSLRWIRSIRIVFDMFD